ncbi:hypothetical protein PSTG_07197 [Puccinia striiformis f. sp. tritici PST-78]|uniref:Tet-like 2OG-Fe(II) oxygenase domain-containing protein n=4 Tax=Puccinia striiformis TaxID=27350 RepID=A0A0L0VKI3_9BASI|nr:hypothetical protein PSTG_07197 [Puccinia striiformis f. sp. tritici PST-78]
MIRMISRVFNIDSAIETTQVLCDKLTKSSGRTASILLEKLSSLGNLAARFAGKEMRKPVLSKPGSILALSSNCCSNDYLPVEEDADSKPLLSFAMAIPTFNSTGMIGLESEARTVDDIQLVSPKANQAIVCVMILRAQQYVHMFIYFPGAKQ